MQTEYEAIFLNILEDRVKARLLDLGAKRVKEKTLMRRVIFESEVTRANNTWVRVRDEGDKVTLTLKQVSDAKALGGKREVSIEVSNFDGTVNFLEGVGMEWRNYQENYREEWRLEKLVFDFDTWPDLPTFLEIEGPDEASVREMALKLDFDMGDARFGSADEIYEEVLGRDILKEPELKF